MASVQAGGDLRVAARMLHPSRCPAEPVPEASKPATPAVEGSAGVGELEERADGAAPGSPAGVDGGEEARERRAHAREEEEGKDDTAPASKRRKAEDGAASPRPLGGDAEGEQHLEEAGVQLAASPGLPGPEAASPGPPGPEAASPGSPGPETASRRLPVRTIPSDSLLLQPVTAAASEGEGDHDKSSASGGGALRSADTSMADSASELEDGEATEHELQEATEAAAGEHA